MQLWRQQFLLIFLRTSVMFCTKTILISYGGSNSSQHEEFFLVGQSPPLPYGSGAYAVTDPRIRNGGGSRVRESVARAARRLRLHGCDWRATVNTASTTVDLHRRPAHRHRHRHTDTQTDRQRDGQRCGGIGVYACLSVARIRTRSRSACRLLDVFTHTHTYTPVQRPFFQDYPGGPVPER